MLGRTPTMVKEILNAYRFRPTLGRLELLAGVAASIILVSVLSLIIRNLLLSAPDRTLIFLMIGSEALLLALVFPLVVARLRDIGWKPAFSVLILLPLICDPKLLVVLSPENSEPIRLPDWMLLLGPPVLFTYAFFLLTLLFWRGRSAA
jgi:uncharacterized membrane protein YhaH (DUF805 family)